jgi:hypothetical protein
VAAQCSSCTSFTYHITTIVTYQRSQPVRRTPPTAVLCNEKKYPTAMVQCTGAVSQRLTQHQDYPPVPVSWGRLRAGTAAGCSRSPWLGSRTGSP